MPAPLSDLATGLRALGSLPPLLVWAGGLAGTLWALHLWAKTPAVRPVSRSAGIAAALLAGGLLLTLGQALSRPGSSPTLWHWTFGLVVLPWAVRSTRFGGMAAFGSLLCLAGVVGGIARYLGWAEAATGALLATGTALLALAAVGDRLMRRSLPAPPAPPPPPAVDDQALQQRLDSAEAQEAADKYSRE